MMIINIKFIGIMSGMVILLEREKIPTAVQAGVRLRIMALSMMLVDLPF
jgi:Na+-transporting NADH:ubiquinone oxidoreductase subunit NqrD